MAFGSLAEIVRRAKQTGGSFAGVMIELDCRERQTDRLESFTRMKEMYRAMQQADQSYDSELSSASGLVGGSGKRLEERIASGESLCGDFIGTVMVKALRMGESNACMKRIVAAPTAGSCGVLPAVLLTMEEQLGYSLNEMTEAMSVAAGIGRIIAERAFLAGAAGGCQAEIGSASAMAAGSAVYLKGGDAETVCHAAALALKNLLGLACDPVAGLVEVPCVKRNVVGAVNALTSADMALAGIRSVIPPDEVIDAMRSIGVCMSPALRETGEGGLAATPTGIRIAKEIQG